MEQNSQTNKITAREIYNITERNYAWESFKYVLPRKYASHTQVKGVDGGVFGTKGNYLDQLQKDKRKIPGPTDYKNQGMPSRPKSGKMDKKQRLTYSDEVKVLSNKENIPGPGAYFKRPQSALTETFSRKEEVQKKDHYLNEVQYIASTCPGVGEYNVRVERHVSSPKLFLKASKSRKQLKENKVKYIDTMNCIDGTFACLQKKVKKRNANFFGKSKRFITQSQAEKKPAPNSYKLNQNWSKSNSLMKTTSKKMSLFSGNVYYR